MLALSDAPWSHRSRLLSCSLHAVRYHPHCDSSHGFSVSAVDLRIAKSTCLPMPPVPELRWQACVDTTAAAMCSKILVRYAGGRGIAYAKVVAASNFLSQRQTEQLITVSRLAPAASVAFSILLILP